MKKQHSLLVRQFGLYLDGADSLTPEMEAFIDAVNDTYLAFDDKCTSLEQSLDVKTRELVRTDDELRGVLGDLTDRVRMRTRLHSEVNERLIKEIAERKRAEKKYRGIFENSAGGIFQSTLDGVLLNANPAMAQMLGYDTAEEFMSLMTDMRNQLYAYPEDRDRYVEQLTRDQRVTGFEAQFISKSGSLVWGRVTAVLVLDESGRPSHIEGTCENITQHKEFEQTLQKAKEDAEELSRLKSNLLSMVSHELRTPLTSILGYSKIIYKQFDRLLARLEALDDENGPDRESPLAFEDNACKRIKDNLRIITAEGQRLTDLINDVLDLAKLESGGMEWNDQDIPVDVILGHAVQATRVLFRSKGLLLKQSVPEDLPCVCGDRDRLIQVCINLLSNAAKFTDQGVVTCAAHCDGDTLCFSISDTGKGIAENEKDLVFNKFKQIDDTLTGRPRGTGLGLAICKEIVERHGGRIWVESEPGSGATFHFTAPASR